MRYMVCTVDGQLIDKVDTAHSHHETIRREVGEPGFDIAYCGPVGVFVNDTGHVDGLPRNLVGTLLVCNMAHRPVGPLAGPIVITGWDDSLPSETCSLDDEMASAIRVVHHDIRIVLGLDQGVLTDGVTDLWQQQMRDLAALVDRAPTPTMRVLTGDDALNYLLRNNYGSRR